MHARNKENKIEIFLTPQKLAYNNALILNQSL